MAKRSAITSLSNMLESASEDEFQTNLLAGGSVNENLPPVGKTAARSKARPVKVAKSKAPSHRVSAGSQIVKSGLSVQRKKTVGRKALAERPNLAEADDSEDADEHMNADAGARKGKAASSATARQNAVKEGAKRGRPPKVQAAQRHGQAEQDGIGMSEHEAEIDETELALPSKSNYKSSTTHKKAQGKKQGVSHAPTQVIPETQLDPDAMELDETELPEDDGTANTTTRIIQRSSKLARSQARQPLSSVVHRRPGSASDVERASDPALRRKLGDMTNKFESLNLKYQNLRDVAVREGESNFERLKKAADERAKVQDDLIASLKREIQAQKAIAAEGKELNTQLAVVNAENTSLASENKSLSKSLVDAQNENKALSAKLRAAQMSSQRAESVGPRLPGSAAKASAQRPVLLGTSDAAKEAQRNQLKEELYRDLTGLVILGIKCNDEDNVYDCIQTGRNGTLHFHLSMAVQDNNGKPPATYEDSVYEYTPLIDGSRDGHLSDILPSCLKDEICFPGAQAAKFYTRIFDSMTKKIEYED